MDSDDPDILSFGSMPPEPGRSPEAGRRSGPGGVPGPLARSLRARLGAAVPRRARGVVLPAAGAAGLAVAGLAVAGVALTSAGTAAQPRHTPAAHSVPAVTMRYQAGVSGFLRAELPAVRLSSGQTVPLRTIATTPHCHH